MSTKTFEDVLRQCRETIDRYLSDKAQQEAAEKELCTMRDRSGSSPFGMDTHIFSMDVTLTIPKDCRGPVRTTTGLGEVVRQAILRHYQESGVGVGVIGTVSKKVSGS